MKLTRSLLGTWGRFDGLLRGEYTRPEELAAGRIDLPTRTLLGGCLVLAMSYGLMMGLHGATTGHPWMLVAVPLKVPFLFLATLLVAFPSLYVFSALARSRLDGSRTLRLVLIAVAVHLTVLASFGPVTAFFTFSTSSYPFLKLLNVLFFGVSGWIGLHFLRRALGPVLEGVEGTTAVTGVAAERGAEEEPSTAAPGPDEPGTAVRMEPPEGGEPERPADEEVWRTYASRRAPSAPAPRRRRDPARRIFQVWLGIYGVVGVQMAWILRPFVGDPDLPFEWFRERDSHFLEDLLRTIVALFTS